MKVLERETIETRGWPLTDRMGLNLLAELADREARRRGLVMLTGSGPEALGSEDGPQGQVFRFQAVRLPQGYTWRYVTEEWHGLWDDSGGLRWAVVTSEGELFEGQFS